MSLKPRPTGNAPRSFNIGLFQLTRLATQGILYSCLVSPTRDSIRARSGSLFIVSMSMLTKRSASNFFSQKFVHKFRHLFLVHRRTKSGSITPIPVDERHSHTSYQEQQNSVNYLILFRIISQSPQLFVLRQCPTYTPWIASLEKRPTDNQPPSHLKSILHHYTLKNHHLFRAEFFSQPSSWHTQLTVCSK